MSVRTIDAPGVEIKEIDKSGYTPSLTGTKCYVMGYADKGQPYEPMEFTSKAAWQSYYGEPDNEAERYFYNACAEVINHNGVLYCARLPYDNSSYGKMVGFKYKVGLTPKSIYNAGTYLKEKVDREYIDHNANFEHDAVIHQLENHMTRSLTEDGENTIQDTEIQKFYEKALAENEKLGSYTLYKLTYKVLATDSVKTFIFKKDDDDDDSKYVDAQSKAAELTEINGYTNTHIYAFDKDGTEIASTAATYTTAYSYFVVSLKRNTVVKEFKTADERTDFINENKDKKKSIEFKSGSFSETVADIKEYYGIDATSAKTEITVENTRYTVEYYRYSAEDSLTQEFLSKRDAESWLADYLDGKEDSINEYIYVPQDPTKKDGDYVAVVKRYNFVSESLKSNAEMNSSAADARITELRADTAVLNRTGKDDIQKRAIGFNNELIIESDISALYNRVDLGLNKDEEIVKLYSDELFEPWKSKDLLEITGHEELSDLYDEFKTHGGIKWDALSKRYGLNLEKIKKDAKYYQIREIDDTMDKYIEITHGGEPVEKELTEIDEYRTGEAKVDSGTFWIVDKTCATLKRIPEDSRKGGQTQLLGIFPVITTAANAMYAQSLIEVDNSDVPDYESVISAIVKDYSTAEEDQGWGLLSSDVVKQFANTVATSDGSIRETVSREANTFFLPIQMNSNGGIDTENLKKIGVVVYRAYLDASEGNKVSFTPVESFVGSLDKDAKNPNTGVSTFLDNIINTQSDYIYFFSNCFGNSTLKKTLEQTDLFIVKPGTTGMLGFFEKEAEETISLSSLYQGIDKCFQKVEDINERDIDIICDAGLANIAQYMQSIYGGTKPQPYDINATDELGNPMVKYWKCDSKDAVGAWKTVEFKYDNFCKNTRKDCMFIADGPRPLVLQGQKKIVRSSKPSNTIDANILPYVKYTTGLNTNYGAGYLDWFKIADEFTGDEFWCPPSIKAMGVYIYTDSNFEYWDAPAGLNRGVIAALDTAFSPTAKQAGSIYTKNWNYAINYPYDGIVLEGQKTFLVKNSAFDRVNVRRLFLRLERQSYKVAKYFCYEGNTAYVRQRLVDMLDPLFYQAKVGGGVYDYKIICDETNNTATTIDNNEMHVTIMIKPTKTAEFVILTFQALSTGGSFSES